MEKKPKERVQLNTNRTKRLKKKGGNQPSFQLRGELLGRKRDKCWKETA